jgi:2-polyprenyl-6-hydroxyphenyl methylase/3-demethylubiquinone-9 3-methyltransferase
MTSGAPDAGAVRADLTTRLRRPVAGAIPCKVCAGSARPFGATDFNRSCEAMRGLRLPDSGVAIAYRRCDACGLLFTEAFDDWTHDDFLTHVYNDGYPQVDPDSAARRPAQNAAWFSRTFVAVADRLDMLDYGGGGGRFAADMRAAGYRCETYDPLVAEFASRPQRRFDFITAFETLEHLPDPVAGAADIAALLAPDGVAFVSTLAQPADFERLGMGWWYIGPRNGHVTLYSRPALAALWARVGLRVASFNDNLHMVFRQAPPEYVREALTGGQAG